MIRRRLQNGPRHGIQVSQLRKWRQRASRPITLPTTWPWMRARAQERLAMVQLADEGTFTMTKANLSMCQQKEAVPFRAGIGLKRN